MNKRLLSIIIGSVCIIAAVIILFALKRNDHSIVSDEYMYDGIDTGTYYSEKNMFYLDHDKILHLVDTATGKDIVYCDRPNCNHEPYSRYNENPSCPAVFSGFCAAGNVVYNGHLYFLGNLDSDSADDFLTQYLYEMDTNGENRKKVAALQDIEAISCVLYRDNYVVGAYQNSIEIDDTGNIINGARHEGGIFVIDLESYKVYKEPVLNNENVVITGIYYESGFVYYSAVCFREAVPNETWMMDAQEFDFETFFYDNMLFDIYKYDVKNHENMLVGEIDHFYGSELIGKNVYFSTKEGYFMFDTESGETVSLDMVSDIVPEGKYSLLGYAKGDKDLYFYFKNENGEYVYCLLKGDEVTELIKLPDEEAFAIECICGSSVYISTFDGNSIVTSVLNVDDLKNGVYKPRKLVGG